MQATRMTSAGLGEEHFGDARLGDMRRQRRRVALATQMAKHPGGTLPDKLKNPADLKALYPGIGQPDPVLSSSGTQGRDEVGAMPADHAGESAVEARERGRPCGS